MKIIDDIRNLDKNEEGHIVLDDGNVITEDMINVFSMAITKVKNLKKQESLDNYIRGLERFEELYYQFKSLEEECRIVLKSTSNTYCDNEIINKIKDLKSSNKTAGFFRKQKITLEIYPENKVLDCWTLKDKYNNTFFNHYRSIQRVYPSYIVLYQIGDFYEAFDDNAELFSKICNTSLTWRDNRIREHKMSGVPKRNKNFYIKQLINKDIPVITVSQHIHDERMHRSISKIEIPLSGVDKSQINTY